MNIYSFKNLLEKEVITDIEKDSKVVFSKIEIPMIQRDYAQGRENQSEVRNRFLGAIFDALNNGKDLTLDFVYGSVDDGTFIPLDGQQRLTTLFLLYWYIGVRENKIAEIKDLLKKFTYATRASSRKFCELLCNCGEKIDSTQTPSAVIENASWFFRSYKKDPTIKAMLTMLDAIHLKYDEKPNSNLFDNLEKVQFFILPLNGFNLTEDLYIKMNARGKQLTDFENFKADFEKHITFNSWESGVKYTDTFSLKTDTVWTDLFWRYKNEKNEIDSAYIKFIANVAMIYSENEKKIQELFNHPEKVKSSDFDSKDKFEKLISFLDVYTNNDEKEIGLILWNSKTNVFKELIKTELTTYPQRVLFYAQTLFLLHTTKSDYFTDWMRVVRNITQNSTIDSASAFAGAISLVFELSRGCENIYEWLSKNSIKSSFAETQVTEEIKKAKIIILSDENKKSIHSIEDINFCKGRIDFALFCIDYVESQSNFNCKKMNKIKDVLKEHFNEKTLSNKFRRALLTVGNNDFYDYWSSWSYALDCPKLCLIADTIDLTNNFAYGTSPFRDYLKELVHALSVKKMDTIINEYVCPEDMPNWKKRIIKEVDVEGHDLLDKYCQNHYFGISKNGCECYLFNYYQKPTDINCCEKII